MKETLTKKVGPLPVYVWALIGTAAIAAYMYWRNKKAASSSSATSTNSSTTAADGSSTLPAGSGYAVVGGSGDGWQGFNNNGGTPSTQGPGSSIDPIPISTPTPVPVTTPPPDGTGTGGPPVAPTPTPSPTQPALTKQGGGYWFGLNNETPIQDAATKLWYIWLSPQTAAANPGDTRWYQPSPNHFVKVTAPLLPGTPQFVIGPPPQAAPAQIAPGVVANAQALNSVNIPVGGSGGAGPASAIAPSALQPVTR